MYREGPTSRPAITPQLALRVAVLAGIGLVMFGIVFFRLWYLQVLSGDEFLAAANQNQVREITVRAPRGEIVDREGRVIVGNRAGLAIQITPDELPRRQDEKTELYEHLAEILPGLSVREIRTSVRDQLRNLPFSAATVRNDVPYSVAQYILERQEEFPGVRIERVFLRVYPRRNVGAHIVGTVGEVNADELKERRNRGVVQGDRVGKSGVEYTYDRMLRGRNGASRVQVDAMGTLTDRLSRREPVQGRQLRLSMDLDVQRTGQRALQGRRGGFVAMDVKNGEVLALGSAPSFDPNKFSRQVRQADLDALNNDPGTPLVNRATQGAYPTGSVFKLITAAAGLESGLVTPATVIFDPGYLMVGNRPFTNAGRKPNGPVALRKALSVSSDVYFYRLGRDLDSVGDGLALQRWARRFGLGRETGIDLPSEQKGTIPSPKWRDRVNEQGIGDGTPWTVGHNVNFSVGQGDLQANPLQMAIAYAAIANGGYVVRPHLGLRTEDSAGRVRQELRAGRRRKLGVAPEHRQAIMDGLRQAASAPGGTSTGVFKDFPIPVAGKTGTAERPPNPDQSWYVALAPFPNPRYVVAVTVEGGGFGAEAAAPVARRMLASLFDVRGEENRVVQGAVGAD